MRPCLRLPAPGPPSRRWPGSLQTGQSELCDCHCPSPASDPPRREQTNTGRLLYCNTVIKRQNKPERKSWTNSTLTFDNSKKLQITSKVMKCLARLLAGLQNEANQTDEKREWDKLERRTHTQNSLVRTNSSDSLCSSLKRGNSRNRRLWWHIQTSRLSAFLHETVDPGPAKSPCGKFTHKKI